MDRHNWYYRFLADTDWLNDHHDDIDGSFWNLLLEITEDTGVVYGFEVSERGSGANFSVDVSSGVAYDTYGRRIINDSTTNIEFDVDEDGDPIEVVSSGNERIVSIYAYYHTTDSDPAIDGFGNTVYQITSEDVEFKLYQGAEAVASTATPATNPGDGGILLAHITLSYGDTSVEDADIDESDKEQLTILGFSGFVHDEGDETIDGNWSFNNGSTVSFYSDEGSTLTLEIDGSTGNITTDGTVDGVDISDHDHSGSGQGGTIDHASLSSIGSYIHSDIDSHIDDGSLHFSEGSIDHGSISGLSDNDHPQYARKASSETISASWAFSTAPTSVTPTSGSQVATKDYVDSAAGVSDHGSLSGLSDNDHPQYSRKASSETITGSWSFSSIPSCSTSPSSSNHLANKVYVDSHIISDHGSLSGLSDNDHPQYSRKASSETITGSWSFSSIPSCSTSPSSSSHLANKSYVDSVAGVSDHGSLSGLSDNDHPQYARKASSETISGSWSFSSDLEILGNTLFIDADSDSGLRSDTDDEVILNLGGTDYYEWTSSAFNPIFFYTSDLGTNSTPWVDLYLHGDSAISSRIYFYDVGSSLHQSYIGHYAHSTTPGVIIAGTAGGSYRGIIINQSSCRPTLNDSLTCGNGTYRWSDVYATSGSVNTSDKREKKEIEPLKLGLSFIQSLKPVSYKWKKRKNITHWGFIAQDFLSRFNQETIGLIDYDKESDLYGMRYHELIAPLVKAVQELSQEINQLKLKHAKN